MGWNPCDSMKMPPHIRRVFNKQHEPCDVGLRISGEEALLGAVAPPLTELPRLVGRKELVRRHKGYSGVGVPVSCPTAIGERLAAPLPPDIMLNASAAHGLGVAEFGVV